MLQHYVWTFLCLGIYELLANEILWSLLHARRGVGDSPTVTGSDLLHDVSDARCSDHLSVHH